MKKLASFIILMALTMQYSVAQNLKFGKPSKEEWELTTCAEVPDAPAVVLCKTLKLDYTISSSFSSLSGSTTELGANSLENMGTNKLVSSEGTNMLYTVKMRTKILKDEGKDYANLDILYYYSKNDMNSRDEFYSFKVTVFSNENGKVKKLKLDKEAYKDELISNHFMMRHVRIPQAEAGDIVEVQYELFSNRIAYIYDWQFQDPGIPVQYSSCELEVPCFLNFTVNASIRDNVKSRVDNGNIMIKKESNDMGPAKKCRTNIYRIEAHNMQPWTKDPIREVKGSEIAQVLSKINTSTIDGIPYPLTQPEGRKWITIAPK